MPDPFTIAAVGLQGVSVISNIIGGSKAAKAAKRQAADEKRIEDAVTAERVRQLDVEQRVLRGQTIANTAASGVKTESATPLEVLAEQEREFEREKLITQQVGASRAAVALERGDAVANQYRTAAFGSLAEGLTSVFSLLSDNKRTTGSMWGLSPKGGGSKPVKPGFDPSAGGLP